ncbi:MAG: M48 family metallopeptidase [Deltaproteobacteria bacterium]|nr:M48 family metallopeptidase [Deltaproteobacteria bacterium]
MNIIAVIIFTVIFAEFVLNFISDLLNLRMLRSDLPDAFRGWYDADRYRKSQEYLKINTRFGWVVSSFGLVVFLIFWFSKGFPLVDRWVQVYHQGPVITGIIYIGVLVILKTIISLPFSIYSTFVIEERFGFNKTTWSTFAKDLVKGLFLAVIMGGPLLAGILAFFEYAGAGAWLYCWIAVALYMLAVQYIAPTWIMPLFNKFTLLEEGELKRAIFSYARSIDFPLENVFVMDGSKRSKKSNAFFTGFGKHRRIVLFDTLIKQHKVLELVAVLAHEMGHYKKKHIQKALIIGIAQMGVMFFLLSIFISYQGLFDAFYMDKKSIYAGLIFFGLLYSPVEFFTGILMQMLSRKNEYEADMFSVETTKDQSSMVNALKKLSVHNLSNLLPHRLYVFLNYSHPPVLKRIKAIENLSPAIVETQ